MKTQIGKLTITRHNMIQEWYEEYDDFDNTVYTLVSQYKDEGKNFIWRISPVVKKDELLYTLEDSDEELLNWNNLVEEDCEFETIDKAKEAVEDMEITQDID